MNKDDRYAHCLVSRFDGALCNAERIRAMHPVFALRMDNVAVFVAGVSTALRVEIEGGAK
jgi:hypothetical protein